MILVNQYYLLMYNRWIGVATWRWVANDENCGICRMAFDGCCPDCKIPGDDCPLGKDKQSDEVLFDHQYFDLLPYKLKSCCVACTMRASPRTCIHEKVHNDCNTYHKGGLMS